MLSCVSTITMVLIFLKLYLMRIFYLKFLLFCSVVVGLQLMACNRNELITTPGAGLEFSTDTLTFDTVFTNLGTATRRFKVYNRHNQPIRINRIALGGGQRSDYKINIDGLAGVSAENIEIPAKDSIYIFANVFINPNNGDAIRTDSITFETDGGGTQTVTLYAYGWNANYIGRVGFLTRYVNQTLQLNNSRPYIMMGVISIDSNSCINIPAGTEIYMFGGPTSRPGDRAVLYIGHNSCIRSNVGGNLNNPVEFKTHRLEEDYQQITFHHNGIYLSKTSSDNIIEGTIIRNAVDGIFVDSASINNNPKLRMKNCKIFNVDRSCVLSRGGSIEMSNTILANSNKYNFIGIRGGYYNFRHCTFVNIATGLVSRSEPVLSYRDFEIQVINGVETTVLDRGEAYFTNCIIYGKKTEEIEVVYGNGINSNFSYAFNNCLVKVDTFSQNLFNCLSNQNPLFVDEKENNYQIDSTDSPANNAGTSVVFPAGSMTGPATDAIGRTRTGATPDIGAYTIPD